MIDFKLHPVWVALGLVVAAAGATWYLYKEMREEVRAIARETARFPPGAVVAFNLNGACGDDWEEMPTLRGRFIVGATSSPTDSAAPKPFGVPGGAETFTLSIENLPPHRHQVYAHAGEVVGPTSSVPGAGGTDTNPTPRVLNSQSGLGIGFPPSIVPVRHVPLYVPLTFCTPKR